LMTALIAVMFTSCNNEIMTGEDRTERIPVKMNVGIKPVSTYAANDQWEASDEVGLYMKRAGQALTAFEAIHSDADNVKMSIEGQNLITTPPLMYPASGNVDFVAYYPYTAQVDENYTVAVDISDQEAALPVEILYSNNILNQSPTESPVTLNFNYSLAKMKLTVAGNANANLDANDFANAVVTIEGLSAKATFNLEDGTFTDYQEKQPVTIHRTSAGASSATFEALLLPTDEDITFVFDIGGAIYRHTMPVDYAASTLYQYDFSLDFPEIPQPTVTLLNAVIVPRDEEPKQDISVDASKAMTMTTEASEVTIRMNGSGKVVIDWGDGSPKEGHMLSELTIYTYSYADASSRTITITGENITLFSCLGNKLTSLDVSKNTVLQELSCHGNQITSLDLSKNTALRALESSVNPLNSLDVSNNTALYRLVCHTNGLTDLDLSKNTELKFLGCSYNSLSSLDVSNNPALYYLNCYSNQLSATALDDLFGTLHSNTIQGVEKTINIGDNEGTDTCDRSIAEVKGWEVTIE